MAVDIDLIRAYTDGYVCTHEPGAAITAPTDASSALDVDFKQVGAISSDGLGEQISQGNTDIFIWQKNTLARRIRGEFAKTFTLAAAETSLFNLGLQYPGSVVVQTTEGARVEEVAPESDVRAWVLHGTDGANRALRVYLPKAEITERGDVQWTSQGITVYEWTLSAYPDTLGKVAYRFYIDPDMASA